MDINSGKIRYTDEETARKDKLIPVPKIHEEAAKETAENHSSAFISEDDKFRKWANRHGAMCVYPISGKSHSRLDLRKAKAAHSRKVSKIAKASKKRNRK